MEEQQNNSECQFSQNPLTTVVIPYDDSIEHESECYSAALSEVTLPFWIQNREQDIRRTHDFFLQNIEQFFKYDHVKIKGKRRAYRTTLLLASVACDLLSPDFDGQSCFIFCHGRKDEKRMTQGIKEWLHALDTEIKEERVEELIFYCTFVKYGCEKQETIGKIIKNRPKSKLWIYLEDTVLPESEELAQKWLGSNKVRDAFGRLRTVSLGLP